VCVCEVQCVWWADGRVSREENSRHVSVCVCYYTGCQAVERRLIHDLGQPQQPRGCRGCVGRPWGLLWQDCKLYCTRCCRRLARQTCTGGMYAVSMYAVSVYVVSVYTMSVYVMSVYTMSVYVLGLRRVDMHGGCWV
jgi:hypothetical protein